MAQKVSVRQNVVFNIFSSKISRVKFKLNKTCKLSINKEYRMKILLNGSHLNCHTPGFHLDFKARTTLYSIIKSDKDIDT